MKIDRRIALAGAAAAALVVAGGAGIAQALSGSEEQVSGPQAERAGAAAVRAVGGGSVLEVERDDDGAGVYEVEVRRAAGVQVDVHVDGRFQPVGVVVDDGDAAGENERADDDE